MKQRFSWLLLLTVIFIILIVNDWKNLKHTLRLFKEFRRVMQKNSKYVEDSDFVLIHKAQGKNL